MAFSLAAAASETPNGLSFARSAWSSASRLSLSRWETFAAVAVVEPPPGADFAAAGPLTSGSFCL